MPADHPHRRALAEELHARPPEALNTPSRASWIAVVSEPASRTVEIAALAEISRRYGAPPPAPEAVHFSAELEGVRLRWERHGEFSSYAFLTETPSASPLEETVLDGPLGLWAASLPGEVVFGGHAAVVPGADVASGRESLEFAFGAPASVGVELGGGDAWLISDFRLRPDGFTRFLLLNRGLSARRTGRMVQRIFEIETYRMMAMLALPLARAHGPTILAAERSLAQLTDQIAEQASADDALLDALTHLAADVQRTIASVQFRFGACAAYSALVHRRIAELREVKLFDLQTVEGFMSRRFAPAVDTCESTAKRLDALSERVASASALLSTRVDIAGERQNQMLLASMDRRAKLQLRLQQTVEAISVVPITYYGVSLVGHALAALRAAGIPVAAELAEGVAIPIVATIVVLVLFSAHRHIATADRPGA